MEISVFTTFDDTIKSFITEENSTIYFDPSFDSQLEQFSLIKSVGRLIDIFPIHEKFLQQFSYDFVINENTQPKYFLKKIGGWVTFDLIYKNSIYVKFQNKRLKDVLPIKKIEKTHRIKSTTAPGNRGRKVCYSSFLLRLKFVFWLKVSASKCPPSAIPKTLAEMLISGT